MRYKIVVIEDDIDICKIIEKFLQNHHYAVASTQNGVKGVELCRTFLPDLVLLDLMLPEIDGNTVLQRVRTFTDIPVIVVSAKTMVQTKIDLLKLGADDYLTKPFDLYELLARIEANLKRVSKVQEAEVLTYKEIKIENSTVFIRGTAVSFTATELNILKLFLKYPNKIFSKQNLYESIWNEAYAYDNDTINTHISNLRKKIKARTDEDYIQTIWGIGYKMA